MPIGRGATLGEVNEPEVGTPELLHPRESDDDALLVIAREAAEHPGRIGCIDLLGVAKSDRRRGCGARLLASVEAVGRAECWECLVVATNRDTHAAVRLYTRCGLQEMGDIALMRSA